jgi:hypothetical protein
MDRKQEQFQFIFEGVKNLEVFITARIYRLKMRTESDY